MAFTYTIEGKMPLLPAQVGLTTPSGKISLIWGAWDGTAVTTGDLFSNENFNSCLMCSPIDTSGANAIQVECDPSGKVGQVTMNFTSGHAGRYQALVLEL